MLDLPPLSPRLRRRAKAETAHFLRSLGRMRLEEVRPWLLPWSSAVVARIDLRLTPAGALRALPIELAPPGPATSPDLHRVDLLGDPGEVLAAEALRAAALADPDPALRRFLIGVHVEQEKEHRRGESQHARIERLSRHREAEVSGR